MGEEHKIIGMSPVGSIKRHLNLMQLRELAANQSDQITALRAEVKMLSEALTDLLTAIDYDYGPIEPDSDDIHSLAQGQFSHNHALTVGHVRKAQAALEQKEG